MTLQTPLIAAPPVIQSAGRQHRIAMTKDPATDWPVPNGTAGRFVPKDSTLKYTDKSVSTGRFYTYISGFTNTDPAKVWAIDIGGFAQFQFNPIGDRSIRVRFEEYLIGAGNTRGARSRLTNVLTATQSASSSTLTNVSIVRDTFIYVPTPSRFVALTLVALQTSGDSLNLGILEISLNYQELMK